MKFLFILFFFCSNSFAQINKSKSAKISFGTTILAFLTSDTAWLAADTKLAEVNTHTHDTTYQQSTKIYKNKDVYYGFCGIEDFNSTDGISFEPKSILDSLLKSKKSLKEIYPLFNDITFNKVNDIAYWLYRNSRSEYDANIGIELFACVFIGYENKKLHSYTVAYEIDPTSTGLNRIKKANDYSYTGDTTMFFVGYAKEIREMLAKGQYKFNFKNVKNELPCLIKKEADLYKTKVGMPVDEFVIYSNGDKFAKGLFCNNPVSLFKKSK